MSQPWCKRPGVGQIFLPARTAVIATGLPSASSQSSRPRSWMLVFTHSFHLSHDSWIIAATLRGYPIFNPPCLSSLQQKVWLHLARTSSNSFRFAFASSRRASKSIVKSMFIVVLSLDVVHEVTNTVERSRLTVAIRFRYQLLQLLHSLITVSIMDVVVQEVVDCVVEVVHCFFLSSFTGILYQNSQRS